MDAFNALLPTVRVWIGGGTGTLKLTAWHLLTIYGHIHMGEEITYLVSKNTINVYLSQPYRYFFGCYFFS